MVPVMALPPVVHFSSLYHSASSLSVPGLGDFSHCCIYSDHSNSLPPFAFGRNDWTILFIILTHLGSHYLEYPDVPHTRDVLHTECSIHLKA